jgi:hypothetical protein
LSRTERAPRPLTARGGQSMQNPLRNPGGIGEIDMGRSEPVVPPGRKLRILEVGNHRLFDAAIPDQTDYFYAGTRASRHRPLGPIRFWRALRQLRRGDYDLLVLHAARFAPWHPRTFLGILRSHHINAFSWLFAPYGWWLLHRFHHVPIAAVDLSDTFGIGPHNFGLIDRCRLFFKRELPQDRWQVFFKSGHWDLPGRRWRARPTHQRRLAKLRPISLGALRFPATVDVPKTTDVFFAGDLFRATTLRSDGIPELRALEAEGYKIDLPEGDVPYHEYLKRLAGAWLAWSPAGYGWDCTRHYEAAALGSVALINYPTILRDRPFIDGEHCLFYAPEPGALAKAVREALADKKRLERIAAAAREHLHAHHTLQARAERVAIAILGRKLDGSVATTDASVGG